MKNVRNSRRKEKEEKEIISARRKITQRNFIAKLITMLVTHRLHILKTAKS